MSIVGTGEDPSALWPSRLTAQSATASGASLLVERRRTRPLQQAWHEALDQVHRILVRYEE